MRSFDEGGSEMATYKYTNSDSSGEIVVEYNITPDFSEMIVLHEASVTVSGRARFANDRITSIGCRLYCYKYAGNMGYYSGVGGEETQVNIPMNTWGNFSIRFSVGDAGGSLNNVSQRILPLFINFSIAGGPNVGGLTDYASAYEALLKYRLDPKILAMDFERATPEGQWADDGQYLQCKTLKIAKNSQAVVGDFTKAVITCTGSDGSSRSVNLTEAQLTAALTPDGYSETRPGIFSDFVSALGVDYTLTLTLGDDYDQVAFADAVMRSFARLHLSGAAKGGVAVGMFSSSTNDKPKFEVADSHESFFYGGIYGVTNYVEGEVKTGGHWFDGKPIYRYIWKGDYTLVNPVGISIPLPSPIDTLIHFQGFVTGGTGYRILTFAHYSNIGYTITPSIDYANGTASLIVGSNAAKQYKTCTLLFVIEYTKADPSAIPALPEGPEIFDEPYPDEAIARADYIAMMAGIEIPEDGEDTDNGAQADSSGIESPGLDVESTPPSEHFGLVENYYKYGCWNEKMVRNAVGRWITEDEAEEILTTQEESE